MEDKNLEINSFEQRLKQATISILEMARNSCWNKISTNTSYIISEIKNDELNAFDKSIKRKEENDQKTAKSLEQISTELKAFYKNLYDINLYIYKSEKDNTIIEIQYFPKSSLEPEFYETIINNKPMLHCKVSVPPYIGFKKEKKFDVNWELGGIRYNLNLFWWRMKFNWKYRNRIKNVG